MSTASVPRNVRTTALVVAGFASMTTTKAFSQNQELHIHKSNGEIKIDGKLDEASWQNAEQACCFLKSFPVDTGAALTKTVCRVTYDDRNLYVSAECYDPVRGEFVIQSLKRDYSFPVSDAFAFVMDPFRDQTNGFNFGVNPLNVQREGLVANGGTFGMSTDWDNKWFSETKIDSDKWTVEMAIPFKSIRFKEGETAWLVNFLRNDLKQNELSTWVRVPKSYNATSLAFTGKMIWDEAPKKSGANVALIPYGIVSGTQLNDYKLGSDGRMRDTTYLKYNAGLDAKVAVTSSLNLDVTINPDFSQVEVDAQQINLTRFSLFYPEKRQFFIENSDLFAGFGFTQIRPFFSRRIGLKNGQTVPILGGVRLSGKLNQDWRVGAMSIQTAEVKTLDEASQNYSVLALQRRVFQRSNVTAIVVNRQRYNDAERLGGHDYNRVGGLQYNLASADSKWAGIFFYQQSFNPHDPSNAYAHASYVGYNTDKWSIAWNHEYVGENFVTDIGFVPRLYNYDAATNQTVRMTYWRLEPEIVRYVYPKSNTLRNVGFTLYSSDYFDKNLDYTEQQQNVDVTFNWLNTSHLSVGGNYFAERLVFDSYIGLENPLPKGIYDFFNGYADYTSDTRKKFNYNVSGNAGGFFTGRKYETSATLNLRVQPRAVLAVGADYNFVDFPGTSDDADLLLFGPKVEISFTRSLFFSTFLQYNTGIDNFNVNGRLQWRFKPMSDLFIVYTDNYGVPGLSAKNRALVVKLNYWFGL